MGDLGAGPVVKEELPGIWGNLRKLLLVDIQRETFFFSLEHIRKHGGGVDGQP